MSEAHDFNRAVACAERALAYLKELHAPPGPRNFELFYAYACGHNETLNAELRAILRTHGRLSEAETFRLLQAHFPHHRLHEKAGHVSAEVSAELKHVVDTLHATSRMAEDFARSLEEATRRLARASSPEELKSLTNALLAETRQTADASRKLAKRAAHSNGFIQDLAGALEAARAEALTDELTGIANRRRFEQVLELEMQEAKISAEPLCLALVDVDHFKHFNDSFGHVVGDQVLRLVAQTLKANIRASDHAARYGGEEFALIFPRTPLPDAIKLADKLRHALKGREMVRRSTREPLGTLTLSVGIAHYRPGEPVSALLQRADKCLYAAKQSGRDKVEAESATGVADAA